MNKQTATSVVSLVNGLECMLMRDTFLQLQEDENATNEQLMQDVERWNSYLDSYCLVFREMNKHIPVQ